MLRLDNIQDCKSATSAVGIGKIGRLYRSLGAAQWSRNAPQPRFEPESATADLEMLIDAIIHAELKNVVLPNAPPRCIAQPSFGEAKEWLRSRA